MAPHPRRHCPATPRLVCCAHRSRWGLLDYVPFHFGPRNLFLFNLITGRVSSYSDGQEPLVTLVIDVEAVAAAHPFVFTDGHALAAFSEYHDSLPQLRALDWAAIDGQGFSNQDLDRKRKKQAEFLVHGTLPWSAITGIAVYNDRALQRANELLARYPDRDTPVRIHQPYYFQGYP